MKKILFVSYFGLQKSAVASTRMYNLIEELSKNNLVDVLFPNLFELEKHLYNYSFVNNVYLYPVKKSLVIHHFRNKAKETLENEIRQKNNGITELIKGFILNNYIYYNISFSQENKKYYKIRYKNNIMKRIDLQNYDILITSSGPSIMNYFGYKIKKRNPNIFWVADYRDLNQNNPSKSDKFNFRGKKMDKLAFKYADLITTVSYGAKEQNIENAKKMGFDIRNKSYVLYNGFSLENNSLELSSKEELKSLFVDKDKIYIVYTGTIYSLQKIEYFLKVLADSQQLKFIYAGNSHQLIDVYVQKFNLEDKVINLGFVKKEEAEYLQKKADILLLLKLIDGNKDKGIMTGKFYEYLTKNKKIMVIGDQDEEFNEICKNLKNVDILPYDKDIIAEYLNNLKKEDLKENYDPNIERFSWETLAKEFDDFISQKLKEWKSTT